jgi:outer membrane protein with beta-barrel domain
MAWRLLVPDPVVYLRHPACVLALIAAAAAPAAAQSEGKVAVGGAISTRIAPSSNVGGDHFGVSLLWRLGHSKEGFGWEWGLNWFSSDVDRSIGGSPAFDLGNLRTRPVMVGYGYTHRIGPTAIKGSVQGGYAFTSFEADPSAAAVYRERLGALALSTDVSNALVMRPLFSVWRDVSRKVGMYVSAGYMIARPTLTISTSLGEDRQRIRADMFTLKMGVVYSVF